MRIDYDYLSRFLGVFLDCDEHSLDINYLKLKGISHSTSSGELDEVFMFYFHLLVENELIGPANMKPITLENMGVVMVKPHFQLCPVPIRLTQAGHDFANALNNKEVLEKLKAEFKNAPFKVVFEGGQKLLEHFFKNKLDELISQ